jgi:hypothetical protein
MQSASFSNSFLAELESFLLLVSPSFSRNATFFLESTFKDQINPKRQTAGPPEGGSPELDLASFGLSLLRLSPTLRPSHF